MERQIQEKKDLIQFTFNKKVDMEKLKQQMFLEKQKTMQNNIAYLWKLKFEFMREQDDRYHKRLEKLSKLKKLS